MQFSVIIPLYNKAPYIQKGLESVFAQTFKDFEIVVIDDGSSDDSFTVANEVLKHSPVKYQMIHQENAGVSTARNNGVSVSNGNYICFLDADDWWAPTFLEKMDSFIDNYPDAGIYGTNYFYVKNGRKRVCVTTAATGYINYCKVYAEKLQMPLWTGAVCIPRGVFEEFGGFRPHLKLGEDFDLWIKITLKYNVAFLNEPLAYYFQDSETTWRLTGRLRDPKEHMLWNLNYLENVEKNNPDYKKLVDNLRTYDLFPYYLSSQYRNAAKQELTKVDWDRQPKETYNLYRKPIVLLKCQYSLRKLGSAIKMRLNRLIDTLG